MKQNKIDYDFQIKQQLKNQFQESSLVKYGLIAITVAGGFVALGYGFKLLNFTIFNYKKLRNTLKK
jgi:hypothetical protein